MWLPLSGAAVMFLAAPLVQGCSVVPKTELCLTVVSENIGVSRASVKVDEHCSRSDGVFLFEAEPSVSRRMPNVVNCRLSARSGYGVISLKDVGGFGQLSGPSGSPLSLVPTLIS